MQNGRRGAEHQGARKEAEPFSDGWAPGRDRGVCLLLGRYGKQFIVCFAVGLEQGPIPPLLAAAATKLGYVIPSDHLYRRNRRTRRVGQAVIRIVTGAKFGRLFYSESEGYVNEAMAETSREAGDVQRHRAV